MPAVPRGFAESLAKEADKELQELNAKAEDWRQSLISANNTCKRRGEVIEANKKVMKESANALAEAKDLILENIEEVRANKKEIAELKSALERLGSCEAFTLAGNSTPEVRSRIDYARRALKEKRM